MSHFYKRYFQNLSDSIELRLYADKKEKMFLEFLPLHPDSKDTDNIRWEDWHCYKYHLKIYKTDYEKLLLSYLNQLFPLKDPIDYTIQNYFDVCFDNWIGKTAWILLEKSIKKDLKLKTKEEQEFYSAFLDWIDTALEETEIIVVEGNQ